MSDELQWFYTLALSAYVVYLLYRANKLEGRIDALEGARKQRHSEVSA